MNYFKCSVGGSGKGNTVIVTCAEEFAGQTIVLAKIGKRYTKTCPSTSPYEVRFYGVESGTYTVSATVQGQTYSETVVVQDVSCVLNYGFTWKTWVDTASQLDSTDYASLSEVLADEEAVRELFLEHACVDYMADSTSSNADLETIIENDLCAKWINNSDYALDYLGANVVIKALMDTADKYGYGEWCLMPQVPTMTSNTAPYGTVSADKYFANDPPYYAFDGNTSTKWSAYQQTEPSKGKIQYAFTSAVCVKEALVYVNYDGGYRARDYKINASNDGTTYTTIASGTFTEKSQATKEIVDLSANNTAYSYWQLEIDSTYSGAVAIISLQFYAYAPKGNVPVMTANNAPYGSVVYSSQSNNYQAYRVFDDSAVEWNGQGTTNQYIGYAFTNPVCVKMVRLRNVNTTTNNPKDCKIQWSNDNSTWTDIVDGSFENSNVANGVTTKTIDNDIYALYWRVFISNIHSGTNYTYLQELQFYGRELKVSVPTMTSNTAPFGEASAHTEASATYAAWKVFDGIIGDTTGSDVSFWSAAANQGLGEWVQYDFKKNVKVLSAYIKLRNSGNGFTIRASKDLETWVDVTDEFIGVGENAVFRPNLKNTDGYRYYRTVCTTKGANNVNIYEIQFYGLDYSEKEFEVGTTKKWLYDHGVELETLVMEKGSSGGVIPVNNGSSIELESGSVSSSFSRVGVLYDLSNFGLIRAKIGKFIKVGNNSVAIEVENTNHTSELAVRYINNANDLPNNEYLDISNINQQFYAEFLCGSAKSAKAELTELWLE